MACFADTNVSQSNEATYARCGGICNTHLTTNLPRNLPVNFFLNQLRSDRIMVMSLWPRFFWPTPYIWQAGSLWYHHLGQTRRWSHRLKFAITKMLLNGRWDLAWGLFSVTNIQPHLGRLNQLFLFTIFRLLLKLTELDVCEHTY